MEVTVTHHVDASEPDAQGAYEFYYEYDLYAFRDGNLKLTARSYIDSPGEAHFLNIERGGTPRLLRRGDLESALFSQAVAYLRNAGKHRLTWLSGRGSGYQPVPDTGTSQEYLG